MASLFWVGGTGSYDGTTNHFATTTGGAASVAAVTSADTVTFDSNSGTGTVTIAANWSSGAVTVAQPGLTVTTNGTATWTVAAASQVTLTEGTINTNGSTCSWGIFKTAGTSAQLKTLSLGSSTVTMTGTVGTIWDITVGSTGVTLNAGTSTISSSVANVTWQLGTNTYYNLAISVTTVTYQGNATFNNVTCQPTAGTGALIILGANWTINGLLTLVCTDTGTNGARGWLTSSTTPNGSSPHTLTLANTPVLQNFDFSDMIMSGTGAPYSGTNLGDGLGNSGLTFPASRTLYWVGTAGAWTTLNRWALSSGGTAGGNHMPLAHDDVVIDANSAIVSGTMTTNRTLGRNLDFSAASNAFTWSLGLSPAVVFGSVSLKAGMTISGTGQLALCGRSAYTLTTNGVSFGGTSASGMISVCAGGGGSYTLQDNLTTASTTGITYLYGGLDFNNKDVNIGFFLSTLGNPRTWTMGTGSLTLNNTGSVISVSDINLTLNSTGSSIFVTDTSATAKTVNLPNAKTMGNLSLAGGTGSITVQWAGASTGHFGTVNNFTVTAPASLVFSAGQTMTVAGTPTMTGSLGNVITLTSGTPGTQYTLSKSSGVWSSNYLSLTDCAATGGVGFYAGLNSTNVSNNTGWHFYPPIYVQRGSMQFVGGGTTVSATFTTPIDTSQSFIRSWVPVSGQTAPNIFMAAVNFTTTGTSVNSITATRYVGTGTPTVYFEIISMHNTKVQHFPLVAFATTDATINQTLTTLGGTTKAFALTNGVVNSATTGNAHGGWFRGNITTTTNVAITRGATTSSAAQVSVQVVEFTDSTVVEHQTVTANATAVTATTANAIDPTKHFVAYSFSATAGVLDAFPVVYLSGTNTLNVNRSVTTGATSTVDAYVVIPSNTSVEVDTGADLATTSNPITIANVTDTTRAFTIPSWSNNGTGSAWASQTGEAIMISTTEVDLNIFSAGNTTPYALQTIQLPAVFTSTTVTKESNLLLLGVS